MRTLNQLFEKSKHIWIYFSTDASKSVFYNEASNSGLKLHFANGKNISEDEIGRLMSLTDDGQMAYISMMVWHYSFILPQDGIDPVSHNKIRSYPKIDYAKFLEDEDNYLMTQNPFRPATPEEAANILEKHYPGKQVDKSSDLLYHIT